MREKLTTRLTLAVFYMAAAGSACHVAVSAGHQHSRSPPFVPIAPAVRDSTYTVASGRTIPSSAGETAEGHCPGDARPAELRRWLEADFGTAFAYLRNNRPDLLSRAAFVEIAACQRRYRDILPFLLASDRFASSRSLAEIWVRQDPQTFSLGLFSGDHLAQAAQGAAQALAARDPAAAFALLEQYPPPPELVADRYGAVFREWMQEDFEVAARFLLDQDARSEKWALALAAFAAELARSDPGETLLWVEDLPPDVRDDVALQLIQALRATDLATARLLARSLDSPVARRETLRSLGGANDEA